MSVHKMLAALAGEVAPGSEEHVYWARRYRLVPGGAGCSGAQVGLARQQHQTIGFACIGDLLSNFDQPELYIVGVDVMFGLCVEPFVRLHALSGSIGRARQPEVLTAPGDLDFQGCFDGPQVLVERTA